MKTSMNWLDLKVWLKEQKEVIVSSYIDNVYLINEKLLLKLRKIGSATPLWLLIDPGCRISLTTVHGIKEFSEASGKQTLWRKLLRDCRIEDLEQLDSERILFIVLRCGSTRRYLVAEFLPRGTICICDGSRKILVISESRIMKDRVLKPGYIYVPPPTKGDISTLSLDQLFENIKIGKDLIRGLIKGWGIPPEVAETVLHIHGIDKNLDIARLSIEDIAKLREIILNFIEEVSLNPKPCIVYDKNGKPIGFYPFIPSIDSDRIELYSSFNEAIDKYFTELMIQKIIEEKTSRIESELERLKKTVESIDVHISKLNKELHNLKRVLEVIEINYPYIEQIHNCVVEKISSIGWDKVTECSVREFDKHRGIIKVEIEGHIVELDVKRRLIDIYNDLKRKVHELESAISRALEEKNRIESRIKELKHRLYEEKEGMAIKLSRTSEWYEKFHWMITSTGFLVLAGRDASQNIALLKKYAEEKDIVLHADIHGASAVVIKTHGKEVDETTLREAAVLAACYSKAWKLGLRSIDVFWVYRNQISFAAPSGQYLPKGSFMVYGKKNYIKNIELKLAIGIEIIGSSYRIVIGPKDVVAKKSIAYMVITPGDVDPSSIAKQFLESISRYPHLKILSRAISVTEIVREVPGKAQIQEVIVKEG